mmetsp:Transcript_13855/g.11840  ORF Transcript_13855/g.11840 Transcript_13855/m.11840 type:complete len:106 (-) Transcript_13855:118-435(-)
MRIESRCHEVVAAPLQIRMYQPLVAAFDVTAPYTVIITAYDATDGQEGLDFPNEGQFTVDVDVGGVVSTSSFRVLTADDFTQLIIKPFWANADVENHVAIELQAS